MNKEDLKEKLSSLAQLRIKDNWFPGCVIGVVAADGEQLIVPAGTFNGTPGSAAITEGSIFDMASVTKAIPTSCLMLALIGEGKIRLDDQVVRFVPELSIRERDHIQIRHLLEFTLNYNNPEYAALGIKYQSADAMTRFMFSSELAEPPGTSYFYTNATAILTGMVVERVVGRPLDVLAREMFFQPLGMTSTDFRPERLPGERIVPTEIDPWRKREVRGEVHDESAWTLRKEKDVCVGSAGLFSSCPDLLIFLEMLLKKGTLRGKQYFPEATIRQMHTNQLARIGEHQGLGWKMERPWMGAHHSPEAFGMSGFTGTSVLCDPVKGVALAILSNGIYPTRARAAKEGLRDIFRSEVIDVALEF